MKFKLFLFACTFSVSTLSFSAFSEESKVCTKTLKTICNESKGQRSRSENYLNEFRRELAKETNKNKSHKTNLKIQSAKSIINEMYGLISKPENVSMFKNYMYQAIDESHFDESIRSKFKKTIESVIIGNFSDFFENNEDKYKQLKAGGAISCGVNAMDINAFSTIIFNQKYVFFCHGFLIELSQLASEEERLSAILQMMSHELAHHIDIKLLGEEIYMPYLSCLSEN